MSTPTVHATITRIVYLLTKMSDAGDRACVLALAEKLAEKEKT